MANHTCHSNCTQFKQEESMPRCLLFMGDSRFETVKVAHPGGTSPEIGSTHVLEIMRDVGNGEFMGELRQFIGISRDLRLSKHHPHHPQHPPHLHRNLHHPHPKQPPLWRLFSLHRVPRRGVFPLYRKSISSTKPRCQNE